MIDDLLAFLRTVPLTQPNLPAFISLLHGTFGSNGAQLIRMTDDPQPSLLQSFEIGLPESIQRDYAQYHAVNPRILTPLPELDVFVDSDYLDREWFRRTEFFDWYSREARSSELMMFRTETSTIATGMLVLGRDETFGYYSDEDLDNGRRVSALLKTNLALTEAANTNWPFAEALISQVAPDSAVILMSPGGQIAGATEAASRLVAVWPDLFEFHQTLRWQRGCAKLGEVCRDALLTGAPQNLRCEDPRGLARPDLEISVMPLSHPLRALEHTMVLLRFAIRPSQRSEVLISRLSPAEYAVCRLLAEGLSLRDISDQRKVSYNTVRNQLARAHDKLETRSIPDILRRYGSLIARSGSITNK